MAPKDGLRPHDHAAQLFETAAEQVEQIVDFLEAGLRAGERCIYAAEEERLDAVVAGLAIRSVPVDAHRSAGDLMLASARGVYVRDGHFDLEGTMGFWDHFLASAQEARVPGLRAAADMGWVDDVRMTPRRLREYETGINTSALIAAGARTICQFDVLRFRPASLQAVLRTHRVVIIDGLVRPNPFFEPPEIIERSQADPRRTAWMIEALRGVAP